MLFVVSIALFISAGLFAQASSDPLDYFYDDLVVWETMGLVNNLPAARPYPLQIVKQILETVIEKGDGRQQQIAQTHYERFFKRHFLIGMTADAVFNADQAKQLGVAISFDFNYEFDKYIGISGSLDGWATTKLPGDELLITGQASKKDIIEDNAKVGPFWILPSYNSAISFGTTEYYLNAGLMRGSYGPFQNNGVIVGPQALHSGQFDFAVNKPKWGYNISLYSLSATSAAKTDAQNYYPEKYISVHSIEYRPYDWFSISFLESIVFGERLETLYLMPLTPYLISQGNAGFRDNSWMGGMFTVKPLQGLKVDGVFYADDLNFKDLIKLKLHTRWRIAGQIGASYAPRTSGLFTLVSLDYTMITPYAYTHRNQDDYSNLETVNYQNYLHAGMPFGADLEPDSDRINLKVKLRPLEDVDLDLIGTFIRHGNVNESIGSDWIIAGLTSEHTYPVDGSFLNPSKTDIVAGHAYLDSTPLLTQDTLQYIWQTGFDALCRLPVLKSSGQIVFRMGYRFECNLNEGINSEIYTYDGSLVGKTDAEILAAGVNKLAAWQESVKGRSFTNLFNFGFEYFF